MTSEQGKLQTNETRHDYREWCQTLDWIVQNIFKEAPSMEWYTEAKERAANPQLTFLRSVAIRLNERRRLNIAVTASDIAELCIDEDLEVPGLSPEKQTVEDGRMQIGKTMGKLFGDKTELAVDEFRIAKQERTEKNTAGNDQKMIRYTFSLVNQLPPTPTTRPVGPA
jgi:hypothetical protein